MQSRDRRAVWMGVLVVVPALLGVWGVRPYLDQRRALAQQIASERDLLAREQALIAARPATDIRATDVSARLGQTRDRLFPGQDDLAATAALATYVSDLAHRHAVLVEQGETRPASPAGGGLVAVEVSIRAAGDLEGVLGLLNALENGTRLTRVTRLGIERTAGTSTEPEHETLTIGLVIRGYASTGDGMTRGRGLKTP
jgi:Tfp pilus assembly protein PilX